MRILTLHCDYIKFKPIKKALKAPEELSEERKKEIIVKDPLVVLTAVESGDNDEIIRQFAESVKKTANEVKAKKIVLYPYAHLSPTLAAPGTALEYLTEAETVLKKEGFEVTRAPFGYYKEFELKCKGHPLSELSKEFKPENFKEENIAPERILKELCHSHLDTSKLKENDHRILGQKLDLFSFSDAAPGMAFWHDKGWIIFNELVKFWRELHRKAGYQEISTPQVMDNRLWKVSGHWEHYRKNMFLSKYENRDFAVKPMNCPGGMLVYKSKPRSYKELPLRIGELGVIHRQELSGVLSGLFRVIKFTQDDAHIFCTQEQLESEVKGIMNLIKIIYKDTFNLDYHIELSTRPETFIGKKADWDKAEKILKNVLKKSKLKYKINKGDGAFYGPKIDFHIEDSLGRKWQCATIQLDMQMPERFDISYTDKDGKNYLPVVLHRVIFGSFERFIGVLLEHLNGALPVWLSPVQIRVLSFTDRNDKAVEKLVSELKEKMPELRVESDLRSTTINDKVRDAELMKIPYIIVLGDKEEKNNTLAVRVRGKKPEFGVKIEKLLEELNDRIKNRK